jgi:multidrug efflux system outer membrane protein
MLSIPMRSPTPLPPFSMRQHGIMVLGLLSLASCTVGPAFETPEAPTSKRWRHAVTTPAAELPDEWWTLYQNPTLNRLINQALENNQDLAATLARVEMARAMTRIETSSWLPQLGMQNSANLERISSSIFGANLPPGIPLPPLERDRYQGFLTLNYELDLWGKVRRTVEAARAQENAAMEEVAAQRLIVAAEVARTCFLVASLDAQRSILRDTISLRQEALKLQQSRFQGGLANEMDVARARTELSLAENDLTGIERQRGNAFNALANLCGTTPSALDLPSSLSLPRAPRIATGLPATLLRRRPDLRIAEQQLREANARVGIATAEFFPSFKLIGSGGIESIGAEDFMNWKNKAGSIGPQFTIPLFQGGRLRGNLRSTQARYQETVAHFRQSVLTALQEVESATVDLNAYSRQRNQVGDALAAAEETSRLARLRYDKGLASYFEVVDADRTVLTTRLLQAQLDGQRVTASVQLIRALGGGWKSEVK